MCAHEQILAKLCYDYKQHFAYGCAETVHMSKKPINDVLAENLAHFMGERGLSQAALAEASKVAQTTVSLYLNPSRRQPSKSGKIPSAKLGEVESLANGLGVDLWELLRPMTPAQRTAYKKLEDVFKSLQGDGDDHDKSATRRKAG